MRYSISTWLTTIAMLAIADSTAFAQFTVREYNLTGQKVAGHYQAYYYATNDVDRNWLDEQGFVSLDGVEDFKGDFDYINMGNSNGWWHAGSTDGAYPLNNGDFQLANGMADDYILEARAEVVIPAGTWTISLNADDGVQLTMPGANFFGNFRNDDPFSRNSADQFFYRNNKSHQATGASFTVPEGETLKTLLHATMHERFAGDSFEISIRSGVPDGVRIDGRLPVPEQPGPGKNDWVLLENGAHGWSVGPTDDVPPRNSLGLALSHDSVVEAVISPGSGVFPLGDAVPSAFAVINTVGDGSTFSSGLEARWYAGGNPGDLNGQLARINANEEVAKFTSEQTWWSGSKGDNHTAFANYPAEVAGIGEWTVAPASNNDGYMVWLSGEIDLPAGETIFRMGVDDYSYLAIDTGGNGIAGDELGEVLLNDNISTEASGSKGNGSWVNPVMASSENGGWTKIEAIIAEGVGDDAGMMYWSVGNEDNFPLAAPFREDIGFDPATYAVPSDRLRSVNRGDVENVALKAEFSGAILNLEVSSAFRDSDRVTLSDEMLATELNLAGAIINVSALEGEELVAGDQWVIFKADAVVGLGEATLNLPGGDAAWDFAGLLDGSSDRITYLGNDQPPTCAEISVSRIPGDADGNGKVAFLDFLSMANGFGLPGGYEDGDFDCTGEVAFLDFLILANNFGRTSDASEAIPEPSSAVCLGCGAIVLGLVRYYRRRTTIQE